MFRNLVRLIANILRFLFPLFLRFLRMMFFLAVTSLASIWVGVPQAVTRIADNWVSEATAAGLPHNYSQILRIAGMVVASITLILGWLVLASLTIFILHLLI